MDSQDKEELLTYSNKSSLSSVITDPAYPGMRRGSLPDFGFPMIGEVMGANLYS